MLRMESPKFGPLVECCLAHGICRSVAFELAAKGLLDTFKIGSRRYVILASLYGLPSRLKGQSEDAATVGQLLV